MERITVIGSGVAGLCCAYHLLKSNCQVDIITASDGPDGDCCTWWAGGMLAPYCEQHNAEPIIATLGLESMRFWQQIAVELGLEYWHNGTLIVSAERDQALIKQFAQRVLVTQFMNQSDVLELEPSLQHFSQALWVDAEAHLNPRAAVQALWEACQALGAKVSTKIKLDNHEIQSIAQQSAWVVDCRGLAAQSEFERLRGVKGEMLLLECPEVALSRPVRLLHPRHPIYLVPRTSNVYMLGATMIEVNQDTHASARSVMELLAAAYSIHPALADAKILEVGVGLRPAFDDNLPKMIVNKNRVSLNGLFRHGFLAAPAMARRIGDYILQQQACEEELCEGIY